MNNIFKFYTKHSLVNLLGIKAKNPQQLLDNIKKVPSSSIYYHTHRFLQQHHYLSPEPPNDFAYWLTNILNLEKLGEKMASIDIVSFKNLDDLRMKFIKILDEYLINKNRSANCADNEEFHFMSCTTFVLPTPYIAHNLNEFIEILGKVTISSLYFHIFEAHLRLGRNENDFTFWLKGIGKNELAQELLKLDPYTITLERLRQKIIEVAKKYDNH